MTVRSRVLDEDENDGRKQGDGGAARVYISAGESLGRKKRTEGTRIAYSSRDKGYVYYCNLRKEGLVATGGEDGK